MAPVYDWIADNPGRNVTAGNFSMSIQLFNTLGIAFNDFVDDMNLFISTAQQENNSAIVTTGMLFEEMSLFWNILHVSAAGPSDSITT